MSRLWSLLIFGFTAIIVKAEACEPGFEPFYYGKCLQVLPKDPLTSTTYADMREKCRERGALPAIIRNDEENMAFAIASQKFANKHDIYVMLVAGYLSLWIGLKCNPKNGKFVWEDGSNAHYQNFYAPYNCSEATENAHFLLNSVQGQWVQIDQENVVIDGIICEHPHVPNDRCPVGMDFVSGDGGDTCISIGLEKLSWKDAEKKCSNASTHLASIHDETVNSYIHRSAIHQGLSKEIHIGAHTKDAYGTVVWNDGSNTEYDNFYTGFPDGDRSGSCVAMHTHSPYNGSWINIECNTKLSYACSRPALSYSSSLPSKCPTKQEYTAGESIYSPGFPINGTAIECDYIIRAQMGKHIEITVVEFKSNMCCDSLTLHDIQGMEEPIMLRGVYSAGTTFTSMTNYVKMTWNATNAVNVRGFHLETRAV